MFEINGDADIQVIKDIKGRSAVIIDDFYKNPDELRELALSLEYTDDGTAVAGLPGSRAFFETPELKEKLYDTYLTLCTNSNIWDNPNYHYTGFPAEVFIENWDHLGFNINRLNDASLLNKPMGVVPHQDRWKDYVPGDESTRYHFGSVIYLNTPDECAGGTDLFSYKGSMSMPANEYPLWKQRLIIDWNLSPDLGYSLIDDEVGLTRSEHILRSAREKSRLAGDGTELQKQDDENWTKPAGTGWLACKTAEEKFKYLQEKIKGNDPYTVEFRAEMKYNRMFLYQGDVLHGINVDFGMFTDYHRLNQIFFM